MMPATAGTKYKSAADCAGTSVGAGVAGAGSTAKLVSEKHSAIYAACQCRRG